MQLIFNNLDAGGTYSIYVYLADIHADGTGGFMANIDAGSGVIGLNGAAARKGLIGDQIIIVSYAFFAEDELASYSPKIILLNESNQIKQWLHK